MLAMSIYILASYAWNRTRPRLTARVREAIVRAFAIQCDLSVVWHRSDTSYSSCRRCVPWPHLRAQHVVVGNPGSAKVAPDMAIIKSVFFSLNPFALFEKKIAVRNLLLEEPLLCLERAKDGSNN